MALTSSPGFLLVLYMKMGMTVDAAVREAAEDMWRLSGGLINRVTIHAIDNKGNHKCVAVNGDASNTYWLWREGEAKPQSLPAEIITINPGVTRSSSPAVTYGAGKAKKG